MDALSRNDLLDFLNTLLEAERAGAKALLHIAREATRDDLVLLAKDIHKDEARWCAMLTAAIRRLDGEPSAKTGSFYEKVMVIPEEGARLAFVNRGQDWVVRKLREALPKITDLRLCADLTEMLSSHEDNIARVARSDLLG
jgi:nitronate monooxygenase